MALDKIIDVPFYVVSTKLTCKKKTKIILS